MKSPELEQHFCGANDGEDSCKCFMAGQEAERARSKEEIEGIIKKENKRIYDIIVNIHGEFGIGNPADLEVNNILQVIGYDYSKEVKEKIKNI